MGLCLYWSPTQDMCQSKMPHRGRSCSIILLASCQALIWCNMLFFCCLWGSILSQISFDSKYLLLGYRGISLFVRLNPTLFLHLIPSVLVVPPFHIDFELNWKGVFMEADYGGRPTWFSFVESVWSTKRGSLETARVVELNIRRGLRLRPFLWTALIPGFQREGGWRKVSRWQL